jgi:arsenate reductase (glutaredoxin)
MVILYGISNCDTVKKAKNWLTEHGVVFTFHDYKKQGIGVGKLELWCQKVGWQQLLNKNGLTYKKLHEDEKTAIVNQTTAINYMIKATSSIKRPIVAYDKGLLIGFLPNEYQSALM